MGPRWPDFAASRAVLIGSAQYHDTALSDLPAVEHNVTDLVGLLTDETVSGFAPAAVEAVRNPHGAREVMNAVLPASTAATDLLLVYFAGHGLLMGEAAELHLATTGTVADQPWTSLPFQHLARAIRRSPATVKILLLDCCYSGRAARDLMGDPVHLAVNQVSVDGVYVMTSTSGTRVGKAPPGHRHTAFTGGLLEVVRDGIPTTEALVGMSALYDAVRARMTRGGWPVPEQYHRNNAGNLALVRNAGRRPPPVAPTMTAAGLAAMPPDEAAAALEAVPAADSDDLLRQVAPQRLARILTAADPVVLTNRISLLPVTHAGATLAEMDAPPVARTVCKLAPAGRGAILAELADVNPPLAADVVRLMAPTPLINAVHAGDTPAVVDRLRVLIERAREDGKDLLSPFRVKPNQPALARRLLSRELRDLRERHRITLETAAGTLKWSISKLMRVENGAVAVPPADARRLLDLHDVPHDDPRARYIFQLVEASGRRPWWRSYRQFLWPELITLVSLESAAAQISILALQVVPGIFQTADYMRSILAAFPRAECGYDIQVAVRRHRQAALFDRDDQVDLTVILHENALRREVGNRRTTREQLDRLTEAAARPNVRLHILPSSSRHTPATADLMVVHLDLVTGHGIVYTEAVYRDAVVDDPGQVDLHARLFAGLQRSTLDIERSAALVRQVRDSYR